MSNQQTGLKADIDRIKKSLEGLGMNQQSTAKVLDQTVENIKVMDEYIWALVELSGKESVQAKVKEMRDQRAVREKEAQIASYERGVQDGYISRGGAIGEASIVCGVERDKNGNQANPDGDGWKSVAYVTMPPQIRQLMLGAKEKDIVQLLNGSTFEVQAVYDLDQDKFHQFMTRVPQADEVAGE